MKMLNLKSNWSLAYEAPICVDTVVFTQEVVCTSDATAVESQAGVFEEVIW